MHLQNEWDASKLKVSVKSLGCLKKRQKSLMQVLGKLLTSNIEINISSKYER